MKNIIFCIAFAFVFISCKKAAVTPAYMESADLYQPGNVGSYWIYRNDTTSLANLDTMTVTSQDTVIDGAFFRVVLGTPSKKKSYFNRFQGNYYVYNFASFIGENDTLKSFIGSIDRVKFLFMKDNVKVGDTWSDEFTDDSKKYKITYKIVETDAAKMVDGVSFANVATVKMTFFQGVSIAGPLGTTYFSIPGVDPVYHYYAKRIGLIRSSAGPKLYKYLIK